MFDRNPRIFCRIKYKCFSNLLTNVGHELVFYLDRFQLTTYNFKHLFLKIILLTF